MGSALKCSPPRGSPGSTHKSHSNSALRSMLGEMLVGIWTPRGNGRRGGRFLTLEPTTFTRPKARFCQHPRKSKKITDANDSPLQLIQRPNRPARASSRASSASRSMRRTMSDFRESTKSRSTSSWRVKGSIVHIGLGISCLLYVNQANKTTNRIGRTNRFMNIREGSKTPEVHIALH